MTRALESGPSALIDAESAGALLGVPGSWVLAQARADRIPHVRLGRYVRFDPAELEAWWRGRMRGPATKPGPGPISRAPKSP
jgi:excisionase family DNA binding protein